MSDKLTDAICYCTNNENDSFVKFANDAFDQ